MPTPPPTADRLLKRGPVPAMLRHGFLPPPSLSPSPPSSSLFSSSSSPSSSSSTTTAKTTTTLLDMLAAEDRPPGPPPEPDLDRLLAATRRPDLGPGDVTLTVSSPAAPRLSATVHRSILAANSRFFAANLPPASAPAAVEISDCHDPFLYLHVISLMYSSPPSLPVLPVPSLLSLLHVASALEFDAGVNACVTQLENATWTPEEEASVIAVARRLGIPLSAPVLSRVNRTGPGDGSGELLLGLVGRVLRAKDEKAGRAMKVLIKGLIEEDGGSAVPPVALLGLFRRTAGSLLAENLSPREAENVRWLGELLMGLGQGEEVVKIWSEERELARAHYAAACKDRYEVSRVTAEICAAVGQGRVVVGPAVKKAVLGTWLGGLYEDFGWLRRAGRGFERRPVEDGLGKMILTLPMDQQQALLLEWLDRFLDRGDDCPDLRTAFRVWCRRAFLRNNK